MTEYCFCHAALTTLDSSSDGLCLQDSELQDLPSADQAGPHTSDVALTPRSNDLSHPSAVKKRGRGRPPVYKLSDKRKAQLSAVSVTVHWIFHDCYMTF